MRRVPHLGMYVHQHWGYNHPYAARTWTLDDWRGYAGGLSALGYNTVMIWPILDTIPDPPTPSDIAHLRKLREVVDLLHAEFGMIVLITLGPNTVGNEKAAQFAFENRPFFETDLRLNPGDPEQMGYLMRVRRNLLQYLSNADGAVVIDSDPGGFIGSTNEEFADLLWRHLELLRSLNPSARLYYWMWVGWEAYNRFWEQAEKSTERPHVSFSESDCEAVIRKLMERPGEPWGLLACSPAHERIVEKYGCEERTLFLPYGMMEGEPTFPLTNLHREPIEQEVCRRREKKDYAGLMVNAQTHAVQQPNTYLVSHFARGGTPETVDLPGFADRLIPGAGGVIADAWEALVSGNPDRMRELARQVREKLGANLPTGPYAGLLLGKPERFLNDLCLQLMFRVDMLEFAAAVECSCDWRPPGRALAASWRAWQQQTGFADAYGGPVCDILHPALYRLHIPQVQAVLDDFDNWRSPSVRHGIVPRLLETLEGCI